MKKLLNEYLFFIILIIPIDTFAQQNFANFLDNYKKNLNENFNSKLFLERNTLDINVEVGGYYIKANDKIEKYTKLNQKYSLDKNQFIRFNSNSKVFPITYRTIGVNYFLLNLEIGMYENDRYGYHFFIKVFNQDGITLDSLVVGKYFSGEDSKVFSSFNQSYLFDTIRYNYYSKIFYEQIENPVVKNLKLKFVFNNKTNKYEVSNQKLYTDNQNSIFDVQNINIEYFNGDANQFIQYDFNREKLKLDIGISKNKNDVYLIYSKNEIHGFLERLSHDFLRFRTSVVKCSLIENYLVVEFLDKKKVKVTLENYNIAKKVLMFSEYQIFDLNGILVSKKSFQNNLQFITNLPKLLDMKP